MKKGSERKERGGKRFCFTDRIAFSLLGSLVGSLLAFLKEE